MGDEDEDGEMEAHLANDTNADEDEFGLPSIAASRRKVISMGGQGSDTKGGGGGGGYVASDSLSLLNTEFSSNRARANSSDIAEERGAPTYPVAKKSEGKILRPQYKDILRGLCILSDC